MASNINMQDNLQLPKSLTGIEGLDEITHGGLPKGRPSLICGGPGCGKTLFAMEFLVRGATEYDEPGIFVAFEETSDELAKNVRSLGFDLYKLIEQKKLQIMYVKVERSEIEETGEYDLEGLFIRLDHAIKSVGAKRVVLDTIESLFAGLDNTAILRSELRRLFHWLKEKGVTAVITGERGEGQLTRQGLEEYVSDCVILLDHRVNGQISTRRLRIVKYRGSIHGTNEYPYLIDEDGIAVLPITSLGLQHTVESTRVLTGISELDDMLGEKGFFKGSSILVSGTAGTGKSSIAAHFAKGAGDRGEKVLYFAFEESQDQIIRNMQSINIDLKPLKEKGLVTFYASRPTVSGLEMHLVRMHKLIAKHKPAVVIVDPITNLISAGDKAEAGLMLTRLIDFLKTNHITALFTSLTQDTSFLENTDTNVSSLIDTWIVLKNIEKESNRTRGIYVLKSRGMAHSHGVREYEITDNGVKIGTYSGVKINT